jgi:hypothetical protein
MGIAVRQGRDVVQGGMGVWGIGKRTTLLRLLSPGTRNMIEGRGCFVVAELAVMSHSLAMYDKFDSNRR